jgi:hypothetical protein
VHGHVRRLGARPGVDDRDRVIEPRQHVQLAADLVEDEAGRAAAGHGDVVRRARESGRTCPLSKSVNEEGVDIACCLTPASSAERVQETVENAAKAMNDHA